MAADSASEASDEGFADVSGFLASIEVVCDQESRSATRNKALRRLGHLLWELYSQDRVSERHRLVEVALKRGLIKVAVGMIASGGLPCVQAASEFLGDVMLLSDAAARELLGIFDQVIGRFMCIFQSLDEARPVLTAAVHLCVNLAAACPSGHPHLIPLVQPVCLRIISDPLISAQLRGETILLLANLSLTSASALQRLGVGQALLELLSAGDKPEEEKSVAESVIIYLHGDRRSREVDALMDMDVVGQYCVPLLERTLSGGDFRGMFPYLVYSARLFQVLSQSREYAQALAADPKVIPLLLSTTGVPQCVRMESDSEGRRLALEALRSLNRFSLWPQKCEGDGGPTKEFLERGLLALLGDDSAGIRASAARLWAQLHAGHVTLLLLVGGRLETRGALPFLVWKSRVLGYLFPFLSGGVWSCPAGADQLPSVPLP